MQYDFSNCLVDFTTVPDGTKLVEFFTQLSALKEFTTATEDEIKVAICLSDFDSPFLRVSDQETKVKSIYDYLKLDLKNKKLTFQSVMDWQQPKIIAITSVYLQMQSKHDFTRWWTLNRLYYELQKELNAARGKDDGIDDYITRKLKIEKNSDDFIEKLQRYEQRLFPDVKMKNAIVVNEMVKILSYPERYAQDRTAI